MELAEILMGNDQIKKEGLKHGGKEQVCVCVWGGQAAVTPTSLRDQTKDHEERVRMG